MKQNVMDLWAKSMDISCGTKILNSTQIKQKAEKQQNRLLNSASCLGTLPGPISSRYETIEEQPQVKMTGKASAQEVNDFRYKTTFFAGDLSGTNMFEPKPNDSIF